MNEPEDLTHEPSPSWPTYGGPPATPGLPMPAAPRPASLGHRLGQADGVQLRQELIGAGERPTSKTILTFRLTGATYAHPVEVVLDGTSLVGTVRDGDWVEVAGEPNRDGRYAVQRLTNLTTGSTVIARGGPRTRLVVTVIALAVMLALLLVFIGIAASVWEGFHQFDTP